MLTSRRSVDKDHGISTFWLALILSVALSGVAVAEEGALPNAQHLQLWLRADAGLEQRDGDVVAWADQSGRDNNAVAVDGSKLRLVESGLNGLPAVQFGGEGCLRIPHAAGLEPADGFTVACVFRCVDGFRLAQKKDASSGVAGDAWFLSPGAGLGVAGKYLQSRYFARKHAYVMTSVYDARAGTIRTYANGDLAGDVGGAPAYKGNGDALTIGKRDNPGGTEGYFLGTLAEFIVYNTTFDDGDRVALEQSLLDKYGIATYGRESLNITRVIPGNGCVSIDWEEPALPPGCKAVYCAEVKLRYAPWSEARTKTVPFRKTTAFFDGLMNHADYAVRVSAVEKDSGKRVAQSGGRLVSPAPVPGVVIDYIHKDESHYLAKGVYVGSPSIARLPKGTLIASHDLFGCGSYDFSRVFRSDDDGASWRHAADVEGAFWGTLFVRGEDVYLIACRERFGDIVIHRSTDGAMTWEGPVTVAAGEYHKAPVPVTERDGRLWVCVELHETPGWCAVALSVPKDADLMDGGNWTVSEPLPYDPAWQPEGWNPDHAHISEGNAVVTPDGRLVDVLRWNPPPHYGKAVVLDIAPDGRSLSFRRLMDLNGSLTKFTIRRHPETGVYWSIVNRVPEPRDGVWAVRNVVTLVRSTDLESWTPVCDVLRDDREFAPKYTGFQYIDWLFDGDDIIFVSRTGYNGAHSFHDANHLTFHRIEDYEKVTGPVGP